MAWTSSSTIQTIRRYIWMEKYVSSFSSVTYYSHIVFVLTLCQNPHEMTREELIKEPDGNPHCSPMIHILDSASPEAQPQEDTRIPKPRRPVAPNEGPTIRSESPRQTQYAYRNIELAALNSGRSSNPRPFFSERDLPPSEFRNIFPGDGWTGGMESNGIPSVMPSGNSNITMYGFDTEMTDNQIHSTGLTPNSNNSYNHSSSNTSYSLPNVQEDEPASALQQPVQQPVSMPPIAGVMNAYTAFSPPSNNMYAAPSNSSNNDSSSGSSRSPNMTNGQIFGSNAEMNSSNGQAFAPNANMSNNTGPAFGNPNSEDLSRQYRFQPDAEDPYKALDNWNTPPDLRGLTPSADWDKMMEMMAPGSGWCTTPGGDRG